MPRQLFSRFILFCLLTAVWGLTTARSAADPTPQQAAAKKFPRDQWGAAQVDVTHDADKRVWILQGKKHAVQLHEKDLSLKIQAGPVVWNMVPSGASDMLVKSGDDEFPFAWPTPDASTSSPTMPPSKPALKSSSTTGRANRGA